MLLEFITKEDLNNFKKEMIAELSNLLSTKKETKKWLRSADVRSMLNISPGTLQHLRVSRVLPFTKVGGTIFYDYDDVMKVMELHKSSAA